MTDTPHHVRAPEYISELADGTVKQLNPFSGTEVWTVAGRGNRPLGVKLPDPVPLDPAEHGHYCAFCERRYADSPPEKSRVIRTAEGGWETRHRVSAEDLDATVAEFRRVPNLFEILSYDYWHLNYGYELPDRVRQRRDEYLASPAGRDHVLSVARAKLRAGGLTETVVAALPEDEVLTAASGFFGAGTMCSSPDGTSSTAPPTTPSWRAPARSPPRSTTSSSRSRPNRSRPCSN